MTVFRPLILFLSLAPACNLAFANCEVDSSLIGASYVVSINETSDHAPTKRHIILWRNGRQVAHEYTDTGITEIWERTSNDRLRVVRHFDSYERGIEYQPEEIFIDQDAENWSVKNQLVSKSLLEKMQLDGTAGDACESVSTYSYNTETVQIKLDWLSEQRLVKNYSEATADRTVAWELKAMITNTDEVRSVFASRDDYHTTDYADIGDNESDPFLMKMINLGYVEHGASGFYDEHGHALGGGHHH